jgi:hypothetical protein
MRNPIFISIIILLVRRFIESIRKRYFSSDAVLVHVTEVLIFETN